MTEMKKHIYDKSNGLWYELVGDYYIPLLALPVKQQRPIGKWGRMRWNFLMEHRPLLYNALLFSGRLWTHLADLNKQAQERLLLIIEQMKAAEGVTEELKAADQMEWIRSMNSIRSRAEEIILRELIYEEGAV
ncbi:MAG: TnpV protein [Clostridia bacterium]|nr:TnpV protein [Clostridia bacterium]